MKAASKQDYAGALLLLRLLKRPYSVTMSNMNQTLNMHSLVYSL